MRRLFFNVWYPFLILAIFFIAIKLHSLGIRASDTNIYFYTAKELLSGKILYKDIFFTNFPLIPYAAAFYYIVSGGNLLFYYFTATIEVILTGGVLYWFSYYQSSSRLSATLTSALYLFSFMILSTSDHQTGVFLAALFSLSSYILFQKKKYFFVGACVALALLTKAYSLPLLITYLVVIFLQNRKQLSTFIYGAVSAGGLILLPSLLFARQELWRDVFMYSLTRSQGIQKNEIFWFLLNHDFIFVLLLISSLFLFRKQLFLSVFSLLSILFFLLYKDVYYLYFNVTLPFLCLSLLPFIDELKKHVSLNRFLFPTIGLVFITYNLLTYFSGYDNLQRLPIENMLKTIVAEKPSYLYGVNGITPALAYLSKTPLLNNLVDTNDNIFRKGYLRADTLTRDAIHSHALVITTGAWYPEAQIKEDSLTDVVDKSLLQKHCSVSNRFLFHSEGIVNSVSFFRC